MLLSRRGILNYKTSLTKLARKNRKNPTEPEMRIWCNVLRDKITGYKFLRQKPIGKFIVDFYCSKLLLAIEIDGDSHYQDEDYDIKRTKILNKISVKIIRYTNYEVMGSLEGVYLDVIEQIRIREKELGLNTVSTP